MPPAPTALAKLGIGAADPVTIPLNFRVFEPGITLELRDTNATRGVYEKDGNRVVQARAVVQPRFSAEPTTTELAAILAWGMYGTPTGSGTVSYPLGNTPAARFVNFFPNNGDPFFASNCGVDRMTIAGAQGEPIRCDLDLLGTTYDTAHTFPALVYDQTTHPFVLAQLVLTLGGVSRQTREFQLDVEHNLDRNRFLNSLTLTALVPLRRVIRLTVDVPSGDNPGFWDDGLAAMTGSAVFTNAGGGVLTITFQDIRFQPVSPQFPQDGEGYIRLVGECYRGAAGASPLSVSLSQG